MFKIPEAKELRDKDFIIQRIKEQNDYISNLKFIRKQNMEQIRYEELYNCAMLVMNRFQSILSALG